MSTGTSICKGGTPKPSFKKLSVWAVFHRFDNEKVLRLRTWGIGGHLLYPIFSTRREAHQWMEQKRPELKDLGAEHLAVVAVEVRP